MKFKHYDNLKIFAITAQYGSFSDAADQLNLTKGAISYQIRILEQALGFTVFKRLPRGIVLTAKGHELLQTVQSAFGSIESKITELQTNDTKTLTIGVSTYFASRWLSPRLMDFMQLHPDIRLRIQPMINFEDLTGKGIDLAIRWGKGEWENSSPKPILSCPAFPVGNQAAMSLIDNEGMDIAFSKLTLLKDRDTSTAWSDWFDKAHLKFHEQTDTLMIPDPNVRVQAVIDGQGIALNDNLIDNEIQLGILHKLSPVELTDYGYFVVYPENNETVSSKSAQKFLEWL